MPSTENKNYLFQPKLYFKISGDFLKWECWKKAIQKVKKGETLSKLKVEILKMQVQLQYMERVI